MGLCFYIRVEVQYDSKSFSRRPETSLALSHRPKPPFLLPSPPPPPPPFSQLTPRSGARNGRLLWGGPLLCNSLLPPPRLPAPAYIGARLFVLSLCRDQKATDRPQGAAAGVAIVTLKRLGGAGGGRSPAPGGREGGKASEGLLLRPRREVEGLRWLLHFARGSPLARFRGENSAEGEGDSCVWGGEQAQTAAPPFRFSQSRPPSVTPASRLRPLQYCLLVTSHPPSSRARLYFRHRFKIRKSAKSRSLAA